MEVFCTYRVMSVGCTRIKVELVSFRVEEGLLMGWFIWAGRNVSVIDQLIHRIVIAYMLLWDELFMIVV
jgi:hypothetical protein